MKNCLTYAVAKQLKEGGYVLWRRSKYLRWIPHFIHLDRAGKWSQYVPTKVPRNHFIRWLHLWHFTGKVVEGHIVEEMP